MHTARTQPRDVYNRHWRWRSHGDNEPDKRREREACQRGHLQPEGMARPKVADDTEGQQEQCGRNRGQHNQRNVNDAMELLTAAAVLAVGKMPFVVAAHFRSRQISHIAIFLEGFGDNSLELGRIQFENAVSLKLAMTGCSEESPRIR